MASVQPRPVVFNEKAAKDIQGLAGRFSEYVEARLGPKESANPSREKQVRVVKTISNDFPYPSGQSNKYEVQFGVPDFDRTEVGIETPTFTPYPGADSKKIACSLTPVTINEGDLIYVALCHGKWYIITTGEGTLTIAFDTGGYQNTIPDQQCWYVSLTRVSNDEGPSEEPDEMIGFPEGTKLLYKGNSWDVMTGGNAYNTYLWIYQTCNDNVSMLEWMEGTYVSDWVEQLPENVGDPNDSWIGDSANLLTCYRDEILNTRDKQLKQLTIYEIDDLLGPLDADECDPDNLCTNIPESAYQKQRSIKVKVTSRTCGYSKVPEEDENGYLTVVDHLDAFLYGRTNDDLQGRKGVAVRMIDEGEYECYWMIVYMDMFDEVQMVSDIIIGSRGITIERKRVDIWRECDLPEEWIEGNTCEDS